MRERWFEWCVCRVVSSKWRKSIRIYTYMRINCTCSILCGFQVFGKNFSCGNFAKIFVCVWVHLTCMELYNVQYIIHCRLYIYMCIWKVYLRNIGTSTKHKPSAIKLCHSVIGDISTCELSRHTHAHPNGFRMVCLFFDSSDFDVSMLSIFVVRYI